MTVANIYSATASLGFERELEGGYEHFIPALNRAVRQVNELRPRVKCLPVMYSPPVYSNPHLEESVTVLGNFFVGDVFGSIVFYSGNKESKKFSGRVNYNSPFDRFVLDGVARNVEVYTWTPALLDMTVYPDFDGLCHGDGTVVDTRNITEIWYKTKPQTFSLGDEGKYIELDDDLVQLLPLLLAAYLWLEDEAEKSAYYMNLYRERAASISRRMKCPDAFSFNGWG